MAQKQQSRSKHPILLLFTLLCLEAGIVFLAMPKTTLLNARAGESQSVATFLGQETETQIKQMADKWYTASFIKTGLLKATYEFFINQWEGKEGDLKLDDRGLSALVDKRLDVFWLAVHQAYYRFATMMMWLPYMLPLLIVATIDGLIQREIRKWQFAFSSPAAHQTAVKVIYGVLAVVILSPFLPISMSPLTMPALMGAAAVASWVSMSNIQKRI